MLSLDQLSQMVKEHLGLYNSEEGEICSSKWIVGESNLGGRGLLATEDIQAGEVLFIDHPLLRGPRSGTIIRRGCTVCCKIDSDAFINCSKCALLLCSEACKNSDMHYKDCAIISRWNIKVPLQDVDDTILSRALAAIRVLLLNEKQKQLVHNLEAHKLPQHGSEIRELKQYFDIPVEEEELMFLASCVLDANAFQIATAYGNNEMGMRGLYPVSALMNHCCVSNTRYGYNNENQMTVKASKLIQAGTEIFTCYSGMLWGTPARRTHLYKTKHFWCKCERCSDPTERGTFLAALKCLSADCPGSLLPLEPLNPLSAWQCLECGLRVSSKNTATIQSALGSLMGTLDFGNVYELENFLFNKITKYIPKTNQIVVDLQCRLIWEFGEAEGLHWQELSESRLSAKESLCRATARTVAALGAGEAHLRGLLLYHLHAALAERARRHPHLYEELKSEIESTIDQAYNILNGDISAPPDLELRRCYLGSGCDKPRQERFFILDG